MRPMSIYRFFLFTNFFLRNEKLGKFFISRPRIGADSWTTSKPIVDGVYIKISNHKSVQIPSHLIFNVKIIIFLWYYSQHCFRSFGIFSITSKIQPFLVFKSCNRKLENKRIQNPINFRIQIQASNFIKQISITEQLLLPTN